MDLPVASVEWLDSLVPIVGLARYFQLPFVVAGLARANLSSAALTLGCVHALTQAARIVMWASCRADVVSMSGGQVVGTHRVSAPPRNTSRAAHSDRGPSLSLDESAASEN